jgi:hypothetical protein
MVVSPNLVNNIHHECMSYSNYTGGYFWGSISVSTLIVALDLLMQALDTHRYQIIRYGKPVSFC